MEVELFRVVFVELILSEDGSSFFGNQSSQIIRSLIKLSLKKVFEDICSNGDRRW